jgi:hypothetical protein
VTNPDPKKSVAAGFPPRRFGWLGLGVVALLFGLAAALTWRKWPDILVDFGTQLDTPWRILQGAVLYRDLFYFAGGPFSQYFNALLFKIFGVSFTTLIGANLILTAAMILVVYRHFLAAADVWTATVIGAGIVLVFAFAAYVRNGNYNYIAPYSCEATHGLVLSIFAIAGLSGWIRTGKLRTAAAAGFCTGLVFLTKPDIFIALAAAILAALVFFYLKHGPKNLANSLSALLLAGAVPPLFFLLYFLRVESLRDSLHSVVFGWVPLTEGQITKNQFYLWCLGLDLPLAHLRRIIIYSFVVVVVMALYAWALRRMKNLALPWIKSPAVAQLVLISPLLVWAVCFDWRQCGWPLPPLCLLACILLAWNYKKLEPPQIFPLLWSVFGLVLLAKLGLFPRIWHYGFALAMPAFVSSVYLLFWLLPVLLEAQWGVPVRQLRVLVGLVLLIGFANLFDQSQLLYAQKNSPLGTGGDKMVTYNLSSSEETQGLSDALLWAAEHMPTNATLAIVPEGVMLNYLTRRVNPTPCLFWDPNAMAVFGQINMTAAFEKNPPDYIFIINRDFSEFGIGNFGASPDFGLSLMQWVRKNYQTEMVIGHEPFTNGLFGIEILERRPPAPVSAVQFQK